ncbi:aldo/keto reductase [Sphingomonas sp. DT-207]|uniref:aldo/keto reductase n=1 Tax=Sphingomonas sp. DT-207 TaxID=3396167 RepID=UPI003F1D90E3
MLTRRNFVQTCAGVAAAAAFPGLALGQTGEPHRRTIPKTGEAISAIGLGTFLTFDLLPGADRRHLAQVMKTYVVGGSNVVDTSPLYGMGEVNVGDVAAMFGMNDQLWIASKVWETGEYLGDSSHARQSLDRSMQRLWRSRIDAVQCHSLVNVDTVLPRLKEWKQEGLIRHIGVSHHDDAYYEPLGQWIERGDLDLAQLHYSIAMREAEERLLPMAADKGVGVLVNMPFEKARLFNLVGSRPLPDFARELGIANWADYFLKWVLGHPAVTCVLCATSVPAHAEENVAALRGEIPDADMRRRMARYVEALPGYDGLLRAPWYPGKQYRGVIARAQNGNR